MSSAAGFRAAGHDLVFRGKNYYSLEWMWLESASYAALADSGQLSEDPEDDKPDLLKQAQSFYISEDGTTHILMFDLSYRCVSCSKEIAVGGSRSVTVIVVRR